MKKYYAKLVPEAVREKLYDYYNPSDYAERYEISEAVAKNIIARIYLERSSNKDENLARLEELMLDASNRHSKKQANEHRIKKAKIKTEGIKDANLNVLCHYIITYLLSSEAGEEKTAKKETVSITGYTIHWQDVLILSALYQAYKEGFGTSKGMVHYARLYELIYGRKLSKTKTALIKQWRDTVNQSIANWQSLEGEYNDGEPHNIGCYFFANVEIDAFDDANVLAVQASEMMTIADQRHSYNVINNDLLDESRCAAQELKSYLVYRMTQKMHNTQGVILRETLDRVMGRHIDDRQLNGVLARLCECGLMYRYDKSRVVVEVAEIKHLEAAE